MKYFTRKDHTCKRLQEYCGHRITPDGYQVLGGSGVAYYKVSRVIDILNEHIARWEDHVSPQKVQWVKQWRYFVAILEGLDGVKSV